MVKDTVRLDMKHPQVSRALLIRLRSLGDTVLMTPLCAALKRVAGWELAVVVEKHYEPILRGNPDVDRIFVVEHRPNKLVGRLRLIRQMRRFQPNLAIDLHGGTTSAVLTALSGAKRRVGYLQSRNSYLYNIKVPDSRKIWQKDSVHTVEHQLAILKYLGFPVEPIPPLKVCLDPQDVEFVKDLLGRAGTGENFILIHPAAAFDTKQWDARKFALLGNRLVEKDRQVVVTAGPGQESLLVGIGKNTSSDVHVVDPMPVNRFSALVSLCDLYVGNDTGSTHIAAALGKKIVVIFGSSDSKAWHPWIVEHRLIKSDLPCIPCPGYFCLHFEEPRCIRSIEIEPVFEAVQSML